MDTIQPGIKYTVRRGGETVKLTGQAIIDHNLQAFVVEDGYRGAVADPETPAPPVATTKIVKVRYYSATTGKQSPREYSYYTAEPLAVGMLVKVPTADRQSDCYEVRLQKAIVSAINVPDADIAAFRDKVRTIPAGSVIAAAAPPAPPAPEASPEPVVEDPANMPEIMPLQASLMTSTETVQESDNPNYTVGKLEAEKAKLETPPEFIQEEVRQEEPDPPQDEGPSEGEHVEQLCDEQKAVEQDKPAALVTIERQVGKPVPELLQLYQEAASLLRVAKDRVIATNEDLKPATNDLAIILTCRKAMTARKTELFGPMKAKLDQGISAYNDLMFPVLEADRLTRTQVTAYDNKVRAQVAEATRIEAEKSRLAREEAAFTGTGEFDVPLGTVQAPPPPPERTRTDLGTLGGRDNWKARVVDFKALDDQWKLPNESLLNSHARTTKGERPISGVKFYNDRVVTVRTKAVQ